MEKRGYILLIGSTIWTIGYILFMLFRYDDSQLTIGRVVILICPAVAGLVGAILGSLLISMARQRERQKLGGSSLTLGA
jgi:hypothetical protein